MSSNMPLPLQELAMKNLLRNELVADSALPTLPKKFLPQLFKQAFEGNHVKAVRTIASSWPFPRLPLGVLKRRTTYAETLAVLEEIDKLLVQKVRPRDYQLQVLDLRSVGQTYMDVWSGSADDWLPKTTSETQAVPGPSTAEATQPLKVAVNLYLREACPGTMFSYLIEWHNKRRGLLQLYCNELQIWFPSLQNYRRLSQKVNLEYVETLAFHESYNPAFLFNVAPYMGRMKNLRQLTLSNILSESYISPEKKRNIISRFTSHLLRLEHLQKLHLDAVSFLEGHLPWLLRSVKTILDDLAVTQCKLSVSEWNRLSGFPCVSRLQHLSLGKVRLRNLSPEPLRVLLVNAGPTLVTLDLEDCHIGDDHLSAILPALSSCTQLTDFSFYGNQISMVALKDLLQHTASLRLLKLELYPVPQESYDCRGTPLMRSMRQQCDELLDMLKAIREPVRVFFGTDRCNRCGSRYIYNKTKMCDCRRFY
ncbi:PRAME family member 7-like [Meriones unguiculatus]|uniref:PRAME family member 7-like n=1 Tax=Meriones unguiculatus TaxID=10047 RepID=UPI000B4F9706|nr:PRAME family member 7-like [Meriones unguiculatus]